MSNVIKSFGIQHTGNITQTTMTFYEAQQYGPNYCDKCLYNGAFEGVFYGLCDTCSEPNTSGQIKMFEFIQEIQKCIDDARLDYPTDEHGIVKEAIESGHYILNLYTKSFYEKLLIVENKNSFQYCSECTSLVDSTTIDKRGYCLQCQNPEYDPVWPKGD